MNIDEEKIDDTALALLYLTLHDKCRVWKQIDWEVLNRLHEKGLISDPVNKSKPVILTEDGLEQSQLLFRKLFGK